VLRLTADDTALTAFDELIVTVSTPGNQPPTVEAGADQAITLPDNATLNGSAGDDGLPVGAYFLMSDGTPHMLSDGSVFLVAT